MQKAKSIRTSVLLRRIESLERDLSKTVATQYKLYRIVTYLMYTQNSFGFAFTPLLTAPDRDGTAQNLRGTASSAFNVPNVDKMFKHSLNAEALVP